MNYPNPPSPELANTEIPAIKAITNELLKELESVLNNATLWKEQVSLSLKGVVRILEVLVSMDFFKNANEIDESLRESIKWLENASNELKEKMREYESYFNNFNASMRTNEQEVTNTLNANAANIRSEIERLENEINAKKQEILNSFQNILNAQVKNITDVSQENKNNSIKELQNAKNQITNALNALLNELKSQINALKEQNTESLNQTANAKKQEINALKNEVNTETLEKAKQALEKANETSNRLNDHKVMDIKIYYVDSEIVYNGGTLEWKKIHTFTETDGVFMQANKSYILEVSFNYIWQNGNYNSRVGFGGADSNEPFNYMSEILNRNDTGLQPGFFHAKSFVKPTKDIKKLALFAYSNTKLFINPFISSKALKPGQDPRRIIITITELKRALKITL
ncbi:hypothetical protein [Helicobacter pylori]|uniref:hypothetical protein n=1 Tax=Helicobacter pylori TaxID=210 RepID=UPI0019690D27|nr:hypothetical protein [Helicobacter pylori]